MLFIVGLNRCSREERETLLAQLNVMTGGNIVLDKAGKGLKQIQKTLGKGAEWLAGKCGGDAANRVREMNGKLDWDAEHLAGRMAAERSRLASLSESELAQEFKARLAAIARIEAYSDEAAIACAVIHEAAKTLKIDGRLFSETASLEQVVFESVLKERIEQIKKRLDSLDPEEAVKLEGLLREELERLSDSDREAIRQALGVDVLSAEALLTFLRTASAATIVHMVAGSLGFGVFLFLTTAIKAFSLLIGVTFPFAVYTTATAAMSFVLSLPFLLAIMAVAGGWVLRKTNHKLDMELAKLLIVIGRARLLQVAPEAA